MSVERHSHDLPDPPVQIGIDPHPLSTAAAFVASFPKPVQELETPDEIRSLLSSPPQATDEELRAAIRDLLRHGGYKPTGRGKPASEYLLRASRDGKLSPINVAVDACNAASLHSGCPVSVIDLATAEAPFQIRLAPPGATYVFNSAGQEIDLGGLLCLFDGEGPCANAVKDSQRTKTGPATRRTLSIVWGVAGHQAARDKAYLQYRTLLENAGARTESVEMVDPSEQTK